MQATAPAVTARASAVAKLGVVRPLHAMTHQEYKLSKEIVALSVADTWDRAKLEWELEDIYHEDEPDTCLCSHFPINELCYLRNTKNGNSALVGNVCVKMFLGLPSEKIFDAINRITKDTGKAQNAEAIDHAFKKQGINEWERSFYLNTWRKRALSAKESLKRAQINERVLRNIKNARDGKRPSDHGYHRGSPDDNGC